MGHALIFPLLLYSQMNTPDFRVLAQELLQHAREAQAILIGEGLWDVDDDDEGLFDRADKALATPPPNPVAYIHRQGNHWEVSERVLDDDEKNRGWTEEPLYASHLPAPPPEPGKVTAWMYQGEDDFDGIRWRENWEVTIDEKLARFKSGNKKPIPLFNAQHLAPPPKPPTVMEILELSGEIEEAGLGQIDLVRAALERWGNG